jgi:hypothetical protein
MTETLKMHQFETINWLKSLDGNHRQALNKEGINYGCGRGDDKLALYTKTAPKFGNQKQLECNGLIVREGSWDLLCVPPLRAIRQIRNLKDADLNNFEIVEAVNGTVISLYFDTKWLISSHRSTNITNVHRFGMTFKQYLEDIVNSVLDITLKEFFDGLDQNKSYSFIIEHPRLNKFLDEKKIWFIQSAEQKEDTAEFEFKTGPFGIPSQQRYTPSEYAEKIGLNSDLTIRDILELREFPENYRRETMLMGIILRAKDYFNSPSYFIETKAMAFIRKTWFSQESKGEDELLRIMNGSRYDHEKFVMMFPRHAPVAESFQDFLALLAQQVKQFWLEKNKQKLNLVKDEKGRALLAFRLFDRMEMKTYRPSSSGLSIDDRAFDFVISTIDCAHALDDFEEYLSQLPQDD